MIGALKPYPEYGKPLLQWTGSMPAHWRTERAKHLFTKTDRPVRQDDEVVTCFRDGVVTLRKNRRVRGFTEAIFELGYQGIRKGDLVIHAMDAFAGAVGVSDSDGKGTPVYAVCQPRPGVDARYYASVVREMARSQWISALSRGIRERSTDFRYEMFAAQRLPLPPPEEQVAIVRFLNWANGRLERAIRAKRKIIALLNEQKQAIIHRAVTRGLNPTVPLKPSEIPWLGDIPAHWELTKLKYLSPQITVGIVIQPSRLYVSSGVPALRSLNISQGHISTDNLVFITTEGHEANRKSQLNEGDVIVVRTGRTGTAVIVPPALHGANCIDLLIVRKSLRLKSEYLSLYLQSNGAKNDIAFNSVGAIQAHYNTGTLANLRVPVPPLEEQTNLLRTIANSLGPLLADISRFEREIELLREYRTRFTADVVTGKLDVRETASQLPDEAPIEPVDEGIETDREFESAEEAAIA